MDDRIQVWVAESDNGSIVFDTCPSHSDIYNACEDLELPIKVWAVEAIPVDTEHIFTIED